MAVINEKIPLIDNTVEKMVCGPFVSVLPPPHWSRKTHEEFVHVAH
jgi:hypothetical protein